MTALQPAMQLSEAEASAQSYGPKLQAPDDLGDDGWKAHTTDDDDFDTDDEVRNCGGFEHEASADNMLGVSISRYQDDMKSPTTPAATKSQILEASKSYFAAADDDRDEILEVPSEEIAPDQRGRSPHALPERNIEQEEQMQAVPLPRWVPPSTEKTERRSSLFSSILGAARPRASSRPGMLNGIKKRIPLRPPINLPKRARPSGSAKAMPGSAAPDPLRPGDDRQGTFKDVEWQSETLENGIPSAKPARLHSRSGSYDDAGKGASRRRPTQRRRATSDQSLYLRREPTGAATFDDWNQFSDFSEMVNSRKQAIHDTWQDSAFRIPKLTKVSQGRSPKPMDSNYNAETINNTNANTNSSQLPDVYQNRRESSPTTNGKASKHPILKSTLSRTKGDLVIMGGYRGSILREAQPPYRQLWVPIKAGMNLRKADLEVGLTREDELKMEEKIVADGALSHIGPVDICRRLLRKCRRSPNVQEGKLRVHDYGYDWRLSPDLLADQLIKFLEALPCNSTTLPVEERGAWIIAHSLGGLLTRYAINKRPELFAGVVYAGTPQNCVNILGPIRNGDNVMFSSRILTAQVNFTLRTSFALLPQNGVCFINKKTGERYDLDFFDANTWHKYHLSPCIRPAISRNRPEKKTSLIGSISEMVAQQSRRSSWLPSRNDDSSISLQKDDSSSARDKVNEAKEDAAGAAKGAVPDAELQPELAGSASQSSKNKPAVATQSTIPVPLAKAYLHNTLASVLEFKQQLSHIPEQQSRNAYPPAGVMYGKQTPTVYGAFVASEEAIKYDDAFDDLAFAAGDGVVLASAAQLPPGYRCVRGGRIEVQRGHIGLLGDLEGVGRCLNAVIAARNRGVGLGAYDR